MLEELVGPTGGIDTGGLGSLLPVLPPLKKDASYWGEGGDQIYSDPNRVPTTYTDPLDVTGVRVVNPDTQPLRTGVVEVGSGSDVQTNPYSVDLVNSSLGNYYGNYQLPTVSTSDYLESLGPFELPRIDLPQLPEINYGTNRPGGSLTSDESEDYPGPFGYNTGGIASLMSGGYPRRTGQISGPGTEKSDSIPAMLSDGEFVMTAKAVRGAGKGDRRKGAKKMYALMHQLERNASRG